MLFRSRTAQAILHYERAARLDPSDDDINFNLRIARLKTVDKIDVLPDIFYVRWGKEISGMFTSSMWSTLSIVSFWLMAASTVVYLFSRRLSLRKTGAYGGLVFLLLGITFLLLASGKADSELDRTGAIVMASSSYVKSSPDEKGNDLFILHEGTAVEILDELNGWKKIKIANGTVGWIIADAIEVI